MQLFIVIHHIILLSLFSLELIIKINGKQYSSNSNRPPEQYAIITTSGKQYKPFQTNSNNKLIQSPYDIDYNRKINIKVSDLLTKQAETKLSTSNKIISQNKSIINNHLFKTKFNLNTQQFTKNLTNSNLNKDNSNQRAQIIVKHPNPNSHYSSTSSATISSSSSSNANKNPSKNLKSTLNNDHTWETDYANEFERVDVRVLGERIDSKALLYLRPSSTTSSVRKLRIILGNNLQSEWVSIDPPSNYLNSHSKTIRSSSDLMNRIPKPDQNLIKAINDLNFTILRTVKDNSDLVYPVDLTIDEINTMKTWLLQRATCTVEIVWEDLGSLFWPRYIKRGICVNTHSCSWPPGMRCHPNSLQTLHLLRWVCKNDTGRDNSQTNRAHLYRSQYSTRKRRDDSQYQPNYSSTKENRRSRRVRRLIRKLSRSANGFHCEWSPYEYMVTENCTCGCEQQINVN